MDMMSMKTIKEQILDGLEKRKKDLERQLVMAGDHELEYIIQDTNPRLDEVESLINWIKEF
jgi:hypothetical protein